MGIMGINNVISICIGISVISICCSISYVAQKRLFNKYKNKVKNNIGVSKDNKPTP